MKKILILFFTLLFTLSVFSDTKGSLDKKTDKIVLPELSILNAEIALVLNSTNNYILKKKDGWLWPVSKIVFSKDGDEILVDIVGIDNSWANLFKPDENAIGYFILNDRMIVVALKDYDAKNIEDYFMSSNDSKTFSQPETRLKATNKPSPVWHYKFVDNIMVVTGYEGI